MNITEEILRDIKELIGNGVDEYWWTLDGNFELINRLREAFDMTELSQEYRDIIIDRFKYE